MSIINIRAALEVAINGMSPAISTAWENNAFTPPSSSTPYQQVNVLFATPINNEFGERYEEQGYMQVKLMYPIQVGTAAVAARAELLRSTFRRGNTFTSGGLSTIISDTPEVRPGRIEGDRYVLTIIINFNAYITT